MSARYKGPIVDTDVHHRWKNESEVRSYLPKRWQDFVTADPHNVLSLYPAYSTLGTMFKNKGRMARSYPTDGTDAGSDYGMLKAQLLDRFPYYRAILTHDVGDFGSHLNQEFAQALCRAVNDWNIDKWLSLDERLYSVIAIPNAVPENSAAEIRRLGKHDRMVGVLMVGNPLGRPYGDPLYHPIYEAAAEMGLCVTIHPSVYFHPSDALGITAGPAGNVTHNNSQRSQQAMHYISSFIVNGVFEKYPDLHVLIKEYGVAWLPSLMWRLDENYELFRLESSWVKKRPSDYIRGHVKLSTQPIEVSPENSEGLTTLLEAIDGMDELLCFSSDYPHITYDDPTYVARQLPAAWLRKVFCDNACKVYGWDSPGDDINLTAYAESAPRTVAGGASPPRG